MNICNRVLVYRKQTLCDEYLRWSLAAQAHTHNARRLTERDILTTDIYYYTTTEFGYAKMTFSWQHMVLAKILI